MIKFHDHGILATFTLSKPWGEMNEFERANVEGFLTRATRHLRPETTVVTLAPVEAEDA